MRWQSVLCSKNTKNTNDNFGLNNKIIVLYYGIRVGILTLWTQQFDQILTLG